MPEPPKSAEELLERYARGERNFSAARLGGTRLRTSNLHRIDLSGADLSGVDLSRANLDSADLRGVKCRGVDLSRASLVRADLRGANLCDAKLRDADLTMAVVRDAHLVNADLGGANFGGTYLNQSNLAGATVRDTWFGEATFGGTVLVDLDLSTSRGLVTARHWGPSTIGIDTIYKSQGMIPEVFLRGCGVPESFITYMPSLVGQPIEFYSCFISYSTKDEEFAKRLHARLQQDHLRVWFAPHDIKGGRKLHEQIDEAIRLYDKLLLVLSPHSMASLWVQREILKARQKEERQKGRVLFPIRLCSFDELRDWECLDSDTGLDLAREVRSYFIPDFSSWKDHDAFETSVTRLIQDLRAGENGADPKT